MKNKNTIEQQKKLETRRITIFVYFVFILTCGYCFLALYPALNSTNNAAVVNQLIAVVMFFPTLTMLFARIVTKEGFENSWLHLNLKGNVKVYLLAWFGPGLLTLLGMGLYFLIFPSRFDPNCGFLRQTLEAAGTSVDAMPTPLYMLLATQAVQALLLGPIVNFVTCLGEEWGWRGYLLPKLSEKLSPLYTLLISGVIWGLWHAPLIAVGHNYGVGYQGFPYTGIVAMCCFCIVMGVFLSYVTLKAQSCLPAVLGHGALNSMASIGMYFTADGGDPFIGPAPTGIIGALPFIIVAAVLYVTYFNKKK